jgi:hypothetical protein
MLVSVVAISSAVAMPRQGTPPPAKTGTSTSERIRPGNRQTTRVQPRREGSYGLSSLPSALTRRMASGPLTPELTEQVIEVATEIDRELADQLCELRARDPEGFERAVRTTGTRLIVMAQLRQRDPELYQFKLNELRYDAQVKKKARLVYESRATGSGDMDSLRRDLEDLVRIQVALSIKSKVEYLQRLRDHVQSLEASIEADARSFNETVDSRIERLLEQQEHARDQRGGGVLAGR